MKIKALSPDNEVEIRKLIELFHHTWGDSYPARRVYDLQFWKTHIGSRFVSLVCTEKDRTVGHMALQPDRSNPSCVQLALPLFDLSSEEIGDFFVDLLADFLNRLAARKRWQMLYFFLFGAFPRLQELSYRRLGLSEVAVCPNYLPGSMLRPRGRGVATAAGDCRSPAVVAQKWFQSPGTEQSQTLYIPSRHFAICQYLYQPLGLRREFKTCFNGDYNELDGLPSDWRAIENRVFRNLGITLSTVHPSLLNRWTRAKFFTEQQSGYTRYLFVNLHDPGCPEFCAEIENYGYFFTGILPAFRGRDSVVFYRDALHGDERVRPALALASERAQVLADYISAGQRLRLGEDVPDRDFFHTDAH